LGWSVTLCDVDADALRRTQDSIYPARYGLWDDAIRLCLADEAPVGEFDFIFIGTPPDSHIDLAAAAIEERPRVLLIEKPLCGPGADLELTRRFHERARDSETSVLVGYNHVVGEASLAVERIVAGQKLGQIETIDVEFREHWGGIFAAHHWLNGPAETYLGHWRRGGGACGEHSHAINLWQHFSHIAGAGRVREVSAAADYVADANVDYDRICSLNLRAENGLLGRVVQDVVTSPPRKWGRIQGREGYVQWNFRQVPEQDVVEWCRSDGAVDNHVFAVSRPEDFIAELKHVCNVAEGTEQGSPVSVERGLDTMFVIAAAHLSAQEKRTVFIDWSKGYDSSAFVLDTTTA